MYLKSYKLSIPSIHSISFFNFDSIFRLLAYLLLLIVIGIIFIRTDKYYANPTLAIFGYKLFKVTLADRNNNYDSISVLTKSDLKAGQNVAYQFISESVCFVRKINDGHSTN